MAGMSKTKTLVFSLIPTVVILLGTEVVLRAIWFQKKSPVPFALQTAFRSFRDKVPVRKALVETEILEGKDYYRPHETLGFAYRPGKYVIQQSVEGKKNVFTVSLDRHGRRKTSSDPSKHDGKPEVWVFGCSISVGWSVNDEQTYPWLLQERFPGAKVVNFSGNGYGTAHGMVQLEEALKAGRRPKAVVVGYFRFHDERNTASATRLNIHMGGGYDGMGHIRAYLDKDGELAVKVIPIDHKHGIKKETALLYDHNEHYMELVTRKILVRMKELTEDNGARLVVAGLGTIPSEGLLAFFKSSGIDFLDVHIPFKEKCVDKFQWDCYIPREYKNLPFDTHPSPKAHRWYADKLAPKLEALLKAPAPKKG